MRLLTEPLSNTAFAPYGEVVAHAGKCFRHAMQYPFAGSCPDVRFSMTVNRIVHCAEPVIDIGVLERHPHSPQTFIPLGGTSRALLVVAHPASRDGLDLTSLRAFICPPNQGVVYRAAIWHHAFTCIDGSAEVVIILGRTGRDDDTEYTQLHIPVQVTVNKQHIEGDRTW